MNVDMLQSLTLEAEQKRLRAECNCRIVQADAESFSARVRLYSLSLVEHLQSY